MDQGGKMKRAVLAFVTILMIGAAILSYSNAFASEPPVVEAVIPSLTDAEVAQAKATAMAGVQAVGISGFKIHDVGVWQESKHAKKIGAVVFFDLAGPSELSTSWPMIQYDESEKNTEQPYAQDESNYAVMGATQLIALVDLRKNRLVQLEPFGPDMTVTRDDPNGRRRTTGSGE
jgi:hypothetical protein